MCGLSGFVDFGRLTADPTGVLCRMNRTLAHRGPDAEGYFEQDGAFLGHRRLSVIDLAASRQPMSTADGRFTLVFNGEIYNFRELRAELENAGRAFSTRGDTEVLLQAFAHWGDAALQRLTGMFAFALWDRDDRSLLMARDHLGVKPLYYSWDGTLLAFASELKALIAHPGVAREIDLDSLGAFLECQFIPDEQTIYRGIRKLPAAHALRFQEGRIDLFRYWTLDYRAKLDLNEPDAIDRLDSELQRSVESMRVADVPLGAFISGGIDSSLVAAIMSRSGGAPVETFNIGFADNTAQSEHAEAQRVAEHLGTRHHCMMVTPEDVLGAFDAWVDVFDEPFGDQAALPTLLLARMARRHVTVALTGEGADELFSGYRNYQKRVRDERLTSLLGHRFSPLPALVRHLPPSFQKDRLLKASGLPLEKRYATIPTVFDRATHTRLFSPALFAACTHHIADHAAERFRDCNAASYLERIMHVDLTLWLPDDLLTKVDRATMAFSLEARVPYLDHRFVEFVARLSPALKQHGGTTKYILKKLAARYLPREIIERPKQGFVMPLSEWLAGGLKPAMEHAISPAGLGRRGLFRNGALQRLHAEHLRGRSNHAGRLWALTVLEKWFERYDPGFRL